MFMKERRELEARELAERLFRENGSRLLWIARRNTIDTALAEEALQRRFAPSSGLLNRMGRRRRSPGSSSR
jgi:hypothetical protein